MDAKIGTFIVIASGVDEDRVSGEECDMIEDAEIDAKDVMKQHIQNEEDNRHNYYVYVAKICKKYVAETRCKEIH